MSIEWVRRRGWKLERDSAGHREYRALFLVETAQADPRDAPGLPAKGSAWSDDPRAVCVRMGEPVLYYTHPDGTKTWVVEVVYTTEARRMNLLIYAAHAIAGTNRAIPDWRIAETLGHAVAFGSGGDYPDGRPDAIVCMSISRMREAEAAMERWPDVPLYVLHWDCYSWVWTQPRDGEYSYDRWGRLLLRAKEVWVPSHCTGLQAAQWWDLDRWLVIKSSVPWWDPTPGSLHDGGYLLCTLRRIPDPWCDVFDEVCTELGIPFRRPDHALSWDDYRAEVAGCRALVSHYEELSTGGLTLLEGYRLGKPVLLNDSRWHGGRDYFGSRAGYFKKGDRQDFAACLKSIWEGNGLMEPDHRQWVEENYSDRLMVERMLARIEYHEGQ